MRDMTRRVAVAYAEQRQNLEYPLLKPGASWTETTLRFRTPSSDTPPAEPADFLLEIGVEELPAGDLSAALAQLEQAVPALLADLRLDHGAVRVMGTRAGWWRMSRACPAPRDEET